MNKLIIIGIILLGSVVHGQTNEVRALALKNGFKPDDRIIKAIVNASKRYHVDALELTAVGILETGLGKYAKDRLNTNGTIDKGIFQVNTVNASKCIEYNLSSVEGSSFCAAKLLNSIKKYHNNDYLGRYHSKTPSKKAKYFEKITQVLAKNVD